MNMVWEINLYYYSNLSYNISFTLIMLGFSPISELSIYILVSNYFLYYCHWKGWWDLWGHFPNTNNFHFLFILLLNSKKMSNLFLSLVCFLRQQHINFPFEDKMINCSNNQGKTWMTLGIINLLWTTIAIKEGKNMDHNRYLQTSIFQKEIVIIILTMLKT